MEQKPSSGYQKMVEQFIRPFRGDYCVSSLGPKTFPLDGHLATRTDFILINKRNLQLHCSVYCPMPNPLHQKLADPRRSTVIGLHCNGGSRLE